MTDDDARASLSSTAEMTADPAAPDAVVTASERVDIADYYNDTVIDYNVWSAEGYLHFGYWRPWMNPFSRRPMLESMNRKIFEHLHLSELPAGRIVDLGCGIGAVSRYGSQLYPYLDFHAVSISPGQIAEAKRRQQLPDNQGKRVQYHCADYHRIPLENAFADGVFYLESLCHSTVPEEALTEAARVLKPGGRIVLTDGFLTRPLDKSSKLFRYIVEGVAHNWAVPMFHEIELARRWTAGGRLRLVEDIECGWRLGPSALHAAHLSLIHFFKLLLRGDRTTRWQWRHLTASAFTIALGLYRTNFRYHLLAFERV